MEGLRMLRACRSCGGGFEPYRHRYKYCSDFCRDEGYRARRAESRDRWYARHRSPVPAPRIDWPGLCGWCTQPVVGKREFCSTLCKGRAAQKLLRVCSTCGLEWWPTPGRRFSEAATECWLCRSRHHVRGGAEYGWVRPYRRKALLKRAGNRCEDCGTGEGPFHAHHVRPRALGGSHALENLKLLCEDCHSGSGWARNHAVLVEAGLVIPPRDVQLALVA